MINAILRLRRDNDYNYAKIKDTFIPEDGEICLVDTARDGLRAVCGDGVSTFGELEYIFDLVCKGYYFNDEFYSDSAHTKLIEGSIAKLYIDLSTSTIYHYNGIEYQALSSVSASTDIPKATAETAGIMKLYQTIGNNIDGTMSQKAITDELDDKVEATVNIVEELLILAN